jgi:hypothetical protein
MTGVITISNAGPAGVYTVTVTATDNCGAMTTTTFTLNVNAQPQITGATITRQQGSPSSNSQIATVSDADQAANTLVVTVNGAATATVNGVTVSGISVDASGNVTASVVASCTATNAMFTLTVTDSNGGSNTATLTVNVTPNTPPTLGTYPTTTFNPGGSATVMPSAAPTDNGTVVTLTASAPGFAGVLSGNPSTGVITVLNGNPPGTYTVTVTATDNCGAQSTTTFILTVNSPPVAKCKNVTVEAGPNCMAAASINDGSFDPDGNPVTITQTPPGPYPIGQTMVTLTITDGFGTSSSCVGTVTVVDTTPPTISNITVDPAALWPPNHTMRDVTVNYTSSDLCGTASCSIISVTSNEPINGTGDGDTSPDWEIVGPNLVRLRAERAGGGEGRIYTITIQCVDVNGNSSIATATVVVGHNIKGPLSGSAFKINTPVTFTGAFWDVPGRKHTARWSFNDLSASGTVVEPNGLKLGSVTGTYTFTAPGIYRVRLNITDDKGVTSYVNTAGDIEAIVVVYDQNGGHTIGGGWITSPVGAFAAAPSLTGKVGFGFNSSYAKNATNPKGETWMKFILGEFEFNALNYDYLVVAGAKAQFKGFGKVNGVSGYEFTLTVIDGDIKGGGGVDKFRLKIWRKTTGVIVYDNQMGASDADDPVTPVGSGSSITIKK